MPNFKLDKTKTPPGEPAHFKHFSKIPSSLLYIIHASQIDYIDIKSDGWPMDFKNANSFANRTFFCRKKDQIILTLVF